MSTAYRWYDRMRTQQEKDPCIYILASGQNGTLYIGVTSDLHQRMTEHAQKLIQGFTKKYGVTNLVYYEVYQTMLEAISREKLLKGWHRAWKLRLIEQMNPGWENLFDLATGEIRAGPFDPLLGAPHHRR